MTYWEYMLSMLSDELILLADYYTAVECKNPDVYCTCLKCGKCGRKFDRGFMVDDGGTHISEEEE